MQGSGFRVQSSGSRVRGLGLRVQDSGARTVIFQGFRVRGWGVRLSGLRVSEFQVSGSRGVLNCLGFRFRVFRISGFRVFRNCEAGLRLRVQGSRCRVSGCRIGDSSLLYVSQA